MWYSRASYTTHNAVQWPADCGACRIYAAFEVKLYLCNSTLTTGKNHQQLEISIRQLGVVCATTPLTARRQINMAVHSMNSDKFPFSTFIWVYRSITFR